MKTYPLTQSQLGIFIEMMQHPQMTQYNLGYMTSLPKSIDLDRLEQAFRTIYATCPTFRIRFLTEGDELRQTVDDTRELPIFRLTLSEPECEEYLQKALKPFDPFNDVLCRFHLIETPDRIVSLGDFSHLIADGTSIALLLGKVYLPLAYAGMPLPEQHYGLLSWAEDEEAIFHTAAYEADREYIRQHFQGCEALSLAESVSNPLGKYIRYDEFMPMEGVAEWCKRNDTAPNLLLMAAFAYTLSVVGRESSSVFTTTSHGRIQRRLREAFGMFVVTVPVRAMVDPNAKVADLVRSFRTELMGTIRHGSYPFSHFCRDLQMKPGISFNFYSGGITEEIKLGEESYPCCRLDSNTTCSDLTFTVVERDGQYDLRAESSDRLYSPAFLRSMVHTIKTVAQNMMMQPQAPLQSLSLVTKAEQAELIKLGMGKHINIDVNETFVSAFERQAAKTPVRIAVTDGIGHLTYAELSQCSNLLAHHLTEAGVQPDSFVCVLLDRVKEFPLSVIAIMKAGGAYVPMDTEYPAERLQYILEDSEAKVLITSHDLLEEKQAQGMSLPEGMHVIFIDDVDFSEMAGPINLATPDGLAYMIYTSGSTGRPKGTMLHHAGLWNFIRGVIDMEQLTQEDRIAGHRSFAFDAHIEDMYPVLTLGGSFHIMPSAIRHDLHAIREFLYEHRITGGGYATAVATLLLNTFNDLPMRFITAGGEKLEGVHSEHIEIINVYGPTECTDDTSYYSIPPGTKLESIPIGKPSPNTYGFIVDVSGRLLPRGMAGELCIAGIQVGRGYWQLPNQTAEVFGDCPFTEKDAWGRKVRMYRTGDLCRWNEQGELEYLGRIDQQVKLRGFRIELGEIESRASKFDGIRQAVASVYDGQLLCLYYTSRCLTI